MAEGININEEDVQKQNVPDDLNSLAVGSYVIPDPIRRRRFGHLVSVTAFLNLLLNYFIDWINFAITSLILFLVAIFIYLIDNRISLNQNSIIEHLDNIINHSIGYYSIALTFEFKFKPLFLNPVWTVIVYSHENPPKLKSIVEINAYNLELINDIYTEDIIDA